MEVSQLPIPGLCEHNRRKTDCKDCKASNVCDHDRRKNECKDCKGASICEHGRRRRECIDCGGSSICEHKTLRRRCKQCKGSSICEHNRRKNECRECVGTSVCAHNKLRRHCIQCGGASICIHNRRRNICKECGGSSICEHGRRKGRCRECKEAAASVTSEPEQSPVATPAPWSPPLTPSVPAASSSSFASLNPVHPLPRTLQTNFGSSSSAVLNSGLLSQVFGQKALTSPPTPGLLSPPRLPFGSLPFVPPPPRNASLFGGMGAEAAAQGPSCSAQGGSASSGQCTAALLALLNSNLTLHSAQSRAHAQQQPPPAYPASLLRSNSLPALESSGLGAHALLPKSNSFTGGSQLDVEASQRAAAAHFNTALTNLPRTFNAPANLNPHAAFCPNLVPGAAAAAVTLKPAGSAGPVSFQVPQTGPHWSRPSSASSPAQALYDMSTNSELGHGHVFGHGPGPSGHGHGCQ